MTHDEYHEHVQKHLNESLPNNSELNTFLQNHKDISTIILNLNLDSAEAILKTLYCPIERRKPRDPQVMLRSLILMSLLKIGSISDWVNKTRSQKVWAILAGFAPDDPLFDSKQYTVEYKLLYFKGSYIGFSEKTQYTSINKAIDT